MQRSATDQRLVRSLKRLAIALARLERQTAADHDVSVSQLRILLFLAEQTRGMRISDLADEQGLAVSTMTRNVDLLEKKGLITRQTGAEDRRTVMVELTARGQERSATLQQTTSGAFGRAFGGFHPSDRVERAVALDRVAAALEKVAPAREGELS